MSCGLIDRYVDVLKHVLFSCGINGLQSAGGDFWDADSRTSLLALVLYYSRA